MKKKLLSFALLLFSLVLTFGFYLLPINAQTTVNLGGLDQTAKEVTVFQPQIGNSYDGFVQSKVGQIVGVVLSFVGVVFLILMIYAGITWMTAQGNDQQVTKAKNLLINSTIGIIIVFAAYAITAFIGGEILR